MIEVISELPTFALLVLLIAAFVIAFKIMEMVFETILVSVLSGAFYLSLVYLFGYELTVDNILLFAFLGSALYMTYSFLASAYTVFSRLIGIPYSILVALIKYLKGVTGREHGKKLGQIIKEYSERMELFADKVEAKAERTDGKNRDVKEVVLDKVNDDSKKEN